MTNFTPSPQQADFFAWVSDPAGGSGILRAVAGAGKTTTLVHALTLMSGSVFFGAFNTKIVAEIKSKAERAGATRQSLFISTMHSAGFAAWRRAAPKVRVEPKKVDKLLDGLCAGNASLEAYRGFARKLASYGKAHLMGVKKSADNRCIWGKLAAYYHLEEDPPEGDEHLSAALALTAQVFRASADACRDVVDFDDMLWAPLAFDARFYRNDWVLIDEAQDINPARREMARRMLKPSGRLVAVGDDRQAIYGFTGAGANSLDLIAAEFDCRTLPLTVTYRCPRAVVAYVHRWVDHIEAHPSAPEGTVREIQSAPDAAGQPQPWFYSDTPASTDAILCRYTAPLVMTAYGPIKAGRACRVEGRDIGRGLVALATRWKVSTLDALDKRLDTYLARESEKAGDDEVKVQATADRVATLRVFMERCRARQVRSVVDLVAEIEALFADDVAGVTVLSTIHKAKGREWSRVYWLQARLRTRRALAPHEQVQENNLCYVAGTRAMTDLVLVPEAA